MNIYDFDGTIYDGDSTVDFYLFSLSKKPNILRYVFQQVKGIVLYSTHRIDKTRLKEYFFCFLPAIDVEKMVGQFWKKKKTRIRQWYMNQRNSDDIIISASPEFLLKPICDEIGVSHLIASEVDPDTGRFLSENCYGKNKVERLLSDRDVSIESFDRFYTDSKSDRPLALLAKEAYLVQRNSISRWTIE
ncbi:MAG: HAD-IB family phosphatase [Clostridia bacterium]|nr:HAD-IB family phosphatase [Clostridia bacterium]